ncbi:MAG: hypothetical protein ACKO9Q_13275, partial [Pirellula sp.]
MQTALTVVGDQLWKRICESMDRVELRLRKAVSILESTAIPFAVAGFRTVLLGFAYVAAWALQLVC